MKPISLSSLMLISSTICILLLSSAAATNIVQDFFRSGMKQDGLSLIPFPRSLSWPDNVWACDLKPIFDGLSVFPPALLGVRTKFQQRVARFFQADSLLNFFEPATVLLEGIELTFDIAFDTVISVPQLGDDESYRLTTRAQGKAVRVSISALTSTGVVRGFSAFLQLIARRSSDGKRCIPMGLDIDDEPHHQWRGLMVDVARRFQPVGVLRDVCDGLELARMNVLHLHLMDDQAWRFESFKWPLLHSRGAPDGKYLTQKDLRDLVAYCAEGGVRVVPELAMPSHSAAAIFAYPALAPDHFPKSIANLGWGVFDYALDPSISLVSTFVTDMVAELASVFLDRHVHIGGDEVLWPSLSTRQQQWLSSKGITLDRLQGFFTNSIALPALQRAQKTAIGWNEVYQSSGGVDIVIQWWTSAAFTGPSTLNVLSTGYFLDYVPSAQQLYLSPYMQSYDLGGEACLWTEHIESNFQSRTFPGLFAVAEVLWRSKGNRLLEDSMQYRMYVLEAALALVGPNTVAEYQANVRRLSGVAVDDEVEAGMLLSLLLPSPVRSDRSVPLNDLLDIVKPNSATLQILVWLAEQMLLEKLDPQKPATVAFTRFMKGLATGNGLLSLGPVSEEIRASAVLYLAWMRQVQTGHSGSEERLAALSTGMQTFLGVKTAYRFTINGLKTHLEPVLLAADVGPYNYPVALLDQVTANGGFTSSATVPEGQTTSALADENSGLTVGLAVGLVLGLLVVALLILIIVQIRKASQARAKVVAQFAATIPMSDTVVSEDFHNSGTRSRRSSGWRQEEDDEDVGDLSYMGMGGGATEETFVDYLDNDSNDDFSYLGGGGDDDRDGRDGAVGGQADDDFAYEYL